jgi:hypothetical protein
LYGLAAACAWRMQLSVSGVAKRAMRAMLRMER